MTARVSMLKSHMSLTRFRACFLSGRAKDLSAPRVVGVSTERCLDNEMIRGFGCLRCSNLGFVYFEFTGGLCVRVCVYLRLFE